jgi:hypothetical protein
MRWIATATVVMTALAGPATTYAQTPPTLPPSTPVLQPPPAPQPQTPTPSQTSTAQPTEGALAMTPAQMEKIKRALTSPDVLRRADDRLRFYMEIVARQPNFQDFIGSTDLKNGPVAGAPMTHQDFLNMVTPKQMYSQAGIKPTDLLQFALFNVAAHAAIDKIKEMRAANEYERVQAIRAQIDKELAALRGGGRP